MATSKSVFCAFLLVAIIQAYYCSGLSRRGTVQRISLVSSHEEGENETTESVNTISNTKPSPPPQLNCKKDPSICTKVCGEKSPLPYSATFCSDATGSCICDCRDKLKEECVQTPFTPCFQGCVTANPNPDLFLYRGGNCPVSTGNGSVAYQCACECTVRNKLEVEAEETNDIS